MSRKYNMKKRFFYGTVTDCDRVEIRRTPEIENNVIFFVREGTRVTILADESVDDYWCVLTRTGNKAFVMKKYVEVK